MIELRGNIWELAKGAIVCITTNGSVRKDGACVMGRGIALQAANKWPHLPYDIGQAIREFGNKPKAFDVDGYVSLITFPVKHHWMEKASLDLITKSTEMVANLLLCTEFKVFIPHPGCGNGQLDWEDVRPKIAPLLDDRFYLVSL